MAEISRADFIDRLPAAVFRTSIDGRIMVANRAFAVLFGYDTPADLKEVAAAELYVNPDDRDLIVAEVGAGEEGHSREIQMLRRDGAPFWAEVTSAAHRGSDGRPLYLEGVVVDVTDRRMAEDALRASEELFRTSFEDAPQGLAIMGPDMVPIRVNRALADMLGEQPDKLMAGDARLYVHPDDRKDAMAMVDAVLRGEIDGYRVERRLRHSDGHYVPCVIAASAQRDAQGNTLALVSQILDMSDQVSVQQALAASEAQLRATYMNAPIGVVQLTPELDVSWVNPAFAALMGADPDDIVGTNVADTISPEEREDGLRRVAQLRAGDADSYRVERRIRRQDGAWIDALVVLAAIRGDAGGLTGFISQVVDIGDVKQAEAALARSEELFRSAFEGSPIGMTLRGPDLKLQRANPALAEMVGVSERDYRATEFGDLIASPDDIVVARRNAELMAAGELDLASREVKINRPSGEPLWALTTTSAIRDAHGTLTSILTHAVDITDRKLAEQKLAASEARFRSAFESSPIGMVIRNPDLTPIRVNTAMLDMLLMSEEEFMRAPVSAMVDDPEDREDLFGTLESMFAGDLDVFRRESWLRRADGKHVFTLNTVTAVRERSGKVASVLMQVVDMSDRKEAERELHELVLSKDELVASVSHELRTPLTTVLGLAEELRDRADDFNASERQELVRLIANQAAEMAELINDLLVAAKNVVGSVEVEPQVVDLVTEANSVLRGTSYAAEITARSENIKAWADPFRLRQILRNLLANAAKYGRPPCEIELVASDEACYLRVRDHGRGLPEKEWEAIFDRYYRAHQPEGLQASVGLGLSLSRDLARSMGGDLTYRTEYGLSVFELTLQRANRNY